jgi:FKBP-type peptidyl-prolyl cis-trans isomerase FkpA
MFKKIVLLGLCIVAFTACNKFKVSVEDGLKYQLHEHNDKGKKPKDGDIIKYHMQVFTSKDSLIQSTYVMGFPDFRRVQKGQHKGSLDDGFKMMAEGDSASFFIPADSLFRPPFSQRPPFIESGSDVRFDIRLLKIVTMQEAQKEIETMQAAQAKKSSENAKKQMAIDLDLIDKHLAKKQITNVQKSETGLRFIIENPGTGAAIPSKATVKAKYIGSFLDGRIFDQNQEGAEFALGQGTSIPGFEEGLTRLKKGGKATLYLPSPLGYGDRTAGPIGPNSILVFKIEIVDVK